MPGQVDNSKEYDYYSRLYEEDMRYCECGHQALLHSYWIDEDPPLTYMECNVKPCKCWIYKRDNLRYLEDELAKQQTKEILFG